MQGSCRAFNKKRCSVIYDFAAANYIYNINIHPIRRSTVAIIKNATHLRTEETPLLFIYDELSAFSMPQTRLLKI